jgi:glyoxylase-like metal-dependent hydrolase (beta-lactamase superfamily II)
MNILNVGYRSTNCYLLEPDRAGLLVDVGWPATLPVLQNVIKKKGVAFEKLRYLLVTHYHPDHAGLAQELKNQGVRLLVMDTQVSAIPILARYMKPRDGYQEISPYGNLDLACAGSRSFLLGIGIDGEIVSTPGHSDDSVTLVLDDGSAFTGDLTPPGAATEESKIEVEQSWEKLRTRNVHTIYPGHGPVWHFQ